MALSGPTVVQRYGPTVVKWEEVGNNNGSAYTPPPDTKHVMVQVFGTFGGTLAIQGSNDGGTTWTNLTKRDGNAATTAAAGWMHIDGVPRQIRPSGGAGVTDVDVWLVLR